MTSRLASDKWVRIMSDFGAEGVWAEDGCGVGIEELPVSAGLRSRILAWQDQYEECEDYLPPQDRQSVFDTASFSEEGRQIARAVKSELPDWTVVYFDDERAREDNRGDVDRTHYEYEIT